MRARGPTPGRPKRESPRWSLLERVCGTRTHFSGGSSPLLGIDYRLRSAGGGTRADTNLPDLSKGRRNIQSLGRYRTHVCPLASVLLFGCSQVSLDPSPQLRTNLLFLLASHLVHTFLLVSLFLFSHFFFHFFLIFPLDVGTRYMPITKSMCRIFAS